MASDDTIQQAAKVIDGILSADPQVAREMFGDEPDKIARALAEVGLLAPAPLTEEWAAIDDDGHVWMHYGADGHSPHREYGTSMVSHRWASEWKRYDDRAEGDGNA